MNAAQESQLLEDVRETRDAIRVIQGRCESHMRESQRRTEEVMAHRTALDGPPDNGEHPGLKTRMATAEASIETLAVSQQSTVNWIRSLVGTMIAGILAIVSKWIVKG